MGRRLIYIALVHYPVLNRSGEKIASAITNLDIHDIARLARTYELGAYYLVTPVQEQQNLAHSLLRHWTRGAGADLNPDRKDALELVRTATDMDQVMRDVRIDSGRLPRVYATTARCFHGQISWSALRAELENSILDSFLLLFGTASGLDRSVLENAHGTLAPIQEGGGYNHLSVRSAVAIALDRLLGRDG